MEVSFRKVLLIGGLLVAVIVTLAAAGSLFETNAAGYLQIKQAALSGDLSCRVQPGTYGQFFGDIHTYKEAETFGFGASGEEASHGDEYVETSFNDGTKSKVSGSVRVLLPSDCASLTLVHRKFNSMTGVMSKLVLPAMRKVLFVSGPHMSASESYAERRAEFQSLVEDQLANGVIRTDKQQVEVTDEVTGQKKLVWQVKKITCTKEDGHTCVGGYSREPSVFREFGMSLTNFVIDEITYPQVVLEQIETQRKARMDIITKEAEARQAEARAKKADADAQAQIAETRAREEVAKTQIIVKAEGDKAQAVLEAEKVRDVARLGKEAAEFEKAKQILLGQGEATRKKLVMDADGALQQKLDALIAINAEYAKALATAQPGALVPYMQLGGSGGHGSGNANDLVQLLTAQTARQLSVDVGVQKK